NLGFHYNPELKSWYKSIKNKDILSDIRKIKLYITNTYKNSDLHKDLLEKLDLMLEQIGNNKIAYLLIDDTLKISDVINDVIYLNQDIFYLVNNPFKEKDIEIPVKDKSLQYKNYQKEFVKFALDKKYVLLADEMGLGKTIQAIALINYLNLSKVLIVTPTFLKLNWLNELKIWLVNKALSIHILDTKNIKKFTGFQNKGIYIINYELAEKIFEKFYNNELFNNYKFDIIVYDESHYIKNINAKRTYYSLKFKSNRYLFMTGTPILNNLLDIVPLLLKMLYPSIYSQDYNDYIKQARLFQQYILERYCYYVETNYGIKVLGTKDIDEAKKILKPFMIRRLKKDVLTELPEKIREIVYLQSDKIKDLLKLEKSMYNSLYYNINENQENSDTGLNDIVDMISYDYSIINKANLDLKTKIKIIQDRLHEIVNNNNEKLNNKEIVNMSTFMLLRHLIGLYKIEDGYDFILNTINNLDNNRLVIFTYFNDTAEYLAEKLRKHNIKTLLVTGKLKPDQRFEAVKLFQSNDDNLIVFIGTIKACGVGLNLTKASNLIFVETSLVPAELLQAEDRLHRIGQKNNILINYLIYENSLDENIYRYINKKHKNITNIIE
ncbi:MAG: DEAD/DEAH box helicase, partial [Candidatus Aenigmatarchaeota archaeon]